MADNTLTADPETPTAPPVESVPTSPATTDWRAALPEDLKGSKSLERYKDVPSLAKSYLEIERKLGAGFSVPGEKATPEEWDAYHAKNGRPKSAEDYGTFKPEKLPEGMSWDDERERGFKTIAFKAGLRPDQVKALAEWDQSYQQGLRGKHMQESADAFKETLSVLSETWGPVGSRSFEGQHAIARAAAREVVKGTRNPVLQQQLADFIEADAEFDPLLLYVLNRYGNELLEDRAIPHELGMGMTADEADAQLAALYKDPAWRNGRDPRHKEVLRQIEAFTAIKLGKNNRNLDAEP